MLLIAGTDTRKDPEGRFFESWLILGYFGTTESTDLHGSFGLDSFPCDSVCSVVKPRKSRQKTEDRCQRADLIVKELWDFKLRQSGEVQYRSKCLNPHPGGCRRQKANSYQLFHPFNVCLKRLDTAYEAQDHFTRLKSRSLLGFNLLLVGLVFANLTRLLWSELPGVPARICINLVTTQVHCSQD